MYSSYVLLIAVLCVFITMLVVMIIITTAHSEEESAEEILDSYINRIRHAAEMGKISGEEAEKAIEELEETKKHVANKATLETDTFSENEKVTVIVPDNVKDKGHVVSTQKFDAKEFDIERKKVGSGAYSKDQMKSNKDDIQKPDFYAESDNEGE